MQLLHVLTSIVCRHCFYFTLGSGQWYRAEVLMGISLTVVFCLRTTYFPQWNISSHLYPFLHEWLPCFGNSISYEICHLNKTIHTQNIIGEYRHSVYQKSYSLCLVESCDESLAAGYFTFLVPDNCHPTRSLCIFPYTLSHAECL